MGNEGWEVAQALADKGIAAFVLKYRLFPTPESVEEFTETMNRTFAEATPREETAGERPTPPPARPAGPIRFFQMDDAEAAYKLIVERADEWGVDTDRIGMIGFSAGAMLTMQCALNSKVIKLAFIGPIYGNMGEVQVPENAPYMFNVIATDDFLFNGKTGVIESWYKPEFRLSSTFIKMVVTVLVWATPTRQATRWFDAFIYWLEVNKFLNEKK